MFLTLAEIQAFINFVNGNLGKKIFTDELISNVVPGKKLLTNGVGLGVDLVDDITYQLGIVGSWNIDNLDTPPIDVKIGERYYVSTAGTFNGIYAGEGDIVEFLSLTEIFVYPLESTLVRLSTLDDYATKTYAQGLVVGLLDDRGSFDASVTTDYPTIADDGSGVDGAILKGDIWFISADGTMGANSVLSGYSVRALVDNPGQTDSNWDILNVGLGYVPENVDKKKTSLNGALSSPNDTDYPSTLVVDAALNLKADILDQTHTGAMRLPSSLKIYDTVATTKEVAVDVSGLTVGAPRTVTFPDRNIALGDLPLFAATTNYRQYAIIQQDGLLYSAKVAFTSGASFSVSDWDSIGGVLKSQVTGNQSIVSGYEYFIVASPNVAITLETPDPSAVPDGSRIVIHNLAFNAVATLGKTNWTAGTGFAVAPSFDTVATATIPSYSKGATTVLTSRQSTGVWVKETTYGSTIPVGTTVGAGKAYFAREDDVTATVSFNLGNIPAATNTIVTFPNANVNLGKVSQAASTSTDGYLTSTDWNTFNNKNNKNVRIIRVSTQNYTVTTADADGNTSIYMEYTGVGNPTITIPASLTNPITIFNFSYPKNLNITWSGSHPIGGMGATSPSVIPGFDGIRAYPYKFDTIQYYQVEWVSRTRYSSNMFSIYDYNDITKNIGFNTSGIGTGQLRAIIMPNADVNLGNVAQAASTSTTGYLTSTDWNTFNGKQATLVSGNNIKTVNGSSLLGSGNLTITTPTTFSDIAFRIQDNNNATKQIAFEASGITAGQTRTVTMPDAPVNLGQMMNTVTVLGAYTIPEQESSVNPAQRYHLVMYGSYSINFSYVRGLAQVTNVTGVSITVTIAAPASFINDAGTVITNFTLLAGETAYVTQVGTTLILRRYASASSDNVRVYDQTDVTKRMRWNVSGIATGQTKTITMPNADVNLGTMSSVATTDSNTLSGTRCRIVGGSNNTVNSTDNIAIGCNDTIIEGNNLTLINTSGMGILGVDNSPLNRRAIALGSSTSPQVLFGAVTTNTPMFGAALGGITCCWTTTRAADGVLQYALLDGSNVPSAANSPKPSLGTTYIKGATIIDVEFIVSVGEILPSGGGLLAKRHYFAKRRVYVSATGQLPFYIPLTPNSQVITIDTDVSLGLPATGTCVCGVVVDAVNNRLLPTITVTTGAGQTNWEASVRVTSHFNYK